MKTKYQVFISSTYKDLIEERQAAVEAILKAGHIPAGMELFKSGKTQLQTIKKWIDDSDIYLLILGQRYGSIDSESGKSYTQIEYEYALTKKMPVFSIVIEKSVADKRVASGCNEEDFFEKDNIDLFESFLSFVKTKIVSFANNIETVKLAIHENINEFEDEYDLIGWSKGSNESYEKLLSELNELRKENQSLREMAQTEKNGAWKNIDLILKELEKPFKTVLSASISQKGVNRHYYSKLNIQIDITFKELFALISPFLMDYPNENKAKGIIERELHSFSKAAGTSPEINNQDFQTVKILFIKSNLINVDYLKTTTGSMGLFWKLTPLGKRLMFELRKI